MSFNSEVSLLIIFVYMTCLLVRVDSETTHYYCVEIYLCFYVYSVCFMQLGLLTFSTYLFTIGTVFHFSLFPVSLCILVVLLPDSWSQMEDASNPLSSLFKHFWKAAFRGTYLETVQPL
jgi:hypothetical protein